MQGSTESVCDGAKIGGGDLKFHECGVTMLFEPRHLPAERGEWRS